MMISTVTNHNGVFHADDVFAIATLRLALGDEFDVIRTRDPDVLSASDLRVDVGGCYDPSTGDFDHHQKQGAGARDNGVPYASFGLVWKTYGVQACGGDQDVADEVDRALVQYVDGPDCGYSTDTPKPGLARFTLNELIKLFVPLWNDDNADFDAAFADAVDFARMVLGKEIGYMAAKMEGQRHVRTAMDGRDDPRLLVLDGAYPWKQIATLDQELLYTVYPTATGRWNVQCVPVTPETFDNRKPLPESWAGADAHQLRELTGVTDAIFCHRQCFIAGAASKEGALALARLALDA